MDEMRTLTELGADLHPEHGPSPQLEARALSVTPQSGQRSWRPVLAVAAAVTVLAVGTAIVVNGLDGPNADSGSVRAGNAPAKVVETKPVAFTVQKNADGSVTFTATDLVDAAAATQALNAAGVDGRVVNIPDESCSIGAPNNADHATGYLPDKAGLGEGQDLSESVTVSSANYPPGGGLLLMVRLFNQSGQTSVGVVVLPYTDADDIPTCLRLGF
jgi:hypothetical protein